MPKEAKVFCASMTCRGPVGRFILVCLFGVLASFSLGQSPIRSLASRVLGARAQSFVFETLKSYQDDTIEIEGRGSKIVIRGKTPGVQAAGLMEYLKEYCRCDVSWTARQLALPAVLPKPPKKVRIVSRFKFRYYLNFCTFNYTMSFWNWARWEQELDWMALNGINLCLAAEIGQEAVWQRTLRRLGESDENIAKYLPGPAFGAWWMMGNQQGWGGPDPQSWIDSRVELQMKILARMRELGIRPILSGFYGTVPSSLKLLYPDSRVVSTGKWVGYDRPDMIDPASPLFDKVASTFYEEQAKLYGTARFYAGDPFHEGNVASVDLKQTGIAIEKAMQKASPGSTWVLQAWGSNPHDEMLEGTTRNRTLILDLRGEGGGSYKRRNDFGERPWLLCTIGGFGGKRHFSGWMGSTLTATYDAVQEPGFSGIGAVMEGSSLNDAPYQMLFDLTWRRTAPSAENWCSYYARRRYGAFDPDADAAWRIFAKSVYDLPAQYAEEGEPESVLCARPGLEIKSTSSWGTTERRYKFADLYRGWLRLCSAKSVQHSPAYQLDLVDVTRQVLSDWGQIQQKKMAAAFDRKDISGFDAESSRFMRIFADMDWLLATRREFRLGTWINSARSLGNTPAEKDWLEWNARTQITTWGFGGPSDDLHDYANKEWSGMLGSFYAPRWNLWIAERRKEIRGLETKPIDWYPWEAKWAKGHDGFTNVPLGNPLAEVSAIRGLYGPQIESYLGKS